MGKKLLIACGTGSYDNLPELQLTGIKKTVASVAALFTHRLGYSRVLEEIGNDPTSNQLHEKLDEWLGSGERDASDWVVFYYTGHGDLVADRLYLLTRDYRRNLTSTAFSVDELASMLSSKDASGESRRVKRCLLILDTCYSGAGVLGVSRQLGKLLFEGGNGAMFYLLAASYPRQEAMAGAMAEALIQAVEDPSIGGTRQPLLYFDQLIPAINRRLKSHKAVYSPVAAPDEEPQFFPNPRYFPGLPSGATIADTRRAVETGELKGFWDPISRGVEVESQPGWYFTGRERVLRELSSWLKDPTDMRARVITGRPGSGKSAILARIVTVSDRENRKLMPRQEERLLEAFPTGIIDLAIHAKGKTFQEIEDRLASHLETGASEVLTTLASRVDRFHVVIDALDEATEPARIARDLLTLLLSLPKVKLLVGTRPEYANKLGDGAVQLQIDQSEYLEEADLAKYVTARLLGQAQQAAMTPYEDNPEIARSVAEAVAKRAYPNFLIARLVAEDLVARPQPISRDEIAQSDFPNSVGSAFEQYMARFGTEQKRVRDLLIPLAWAGGLGLPWANIWPVVASGLSGQTYGDEDIRWVLDQAGSFVVETLERDRSVYRLYHQALADHLRSGRDPAPTQRQIAETLIQTVPALADSASKDWRSAQPYILAHLAEHAAVGGMLPKVVNDPLFLLTADADRLVAVMGAYAQEVPPLVMRAYQISLHLVETSPLPERASYLEMGARKAMATDLADQVSKLPLQRTWDVPWVRWLPFSTYSILAQTTDSVTALAVAERQGRTVIVSGSRDNTIRVWDLENGKELCAPLTGHTGWVNTLAVAERRGRTVIVSGSRDNTIRVWDLESGKELCAPLTGHIGSVRTLAVVERQGRTVIVFGGDDKTIRVWDLESDKELCALFTGWVDTLAVAERRGRTVIVSGSDDNTIRVWDLESGKELCAPLTEHIGSVRTLAVVERQGRTVIVSGSDDDNTIRLWDLESGREVCSPLTAHSDWEHTLAVAERQGRTLIVSGGFDWIRVWDLESGKEVCAPLTGQSGWLDALAAVERQGRTLIVFGSSNDNTIRLWDLESNKGACASLTGRIGSVRTLAVAERRGRTVIVSGSDDNTIRVWDLENGKELCAPLTGHTGWVNTLAVVERQGRKVIVSGSNDKTIRVWDLENGREVCSPLIEYTGWVDTLAVAERRGRTVIVSGSDDNTVRLCDLESGGEACASLTRYTRRVHTLARQWVAALFLLRRSSVRIRTLAVTERRGRKVIVSGSDDNTIRVWDLENGKELCAPLTGHTGWVHTLAVAERQGRTVIISSGYDQVIRVWDLESSKEVCAPLTGHTSWVDTLAVAERRGRTVIVSGSDDNTIRVWDLESGEPLRTIEVGAPVHSIVLIAGSKIVAGTNMGLVAVRLH